MHAKLARTASIPSETAPAVPNKLLDLHHINNLDMGALTLPSRKELVEYGRDSGLLPLADKLPKETPWYARVIYGIQYTFHKLFGLSTALHILTAPPLATLSVAALVAGAPEQAAAAAILAALSTAMLYLLPKWTGSDCRHKREAIIKVVRAKQEAGQKASVSDVLDAACSRKGRSIS